MSERAKELIKKAMPQNEYVKRAKDVLMFLPLSTSAKAELADKYKELILEACDIINKRDKKITEQKALLEQIIRLLNDIYRIDLEPIKSEIRKCLKIE